MRGALAVLATCAVMACGRIGFDPVGGGGPGGDGNTGDDGAFAGGCDQHPSQIITTGQAVGTQLLWDGTEFVIAWSDRSMPVPWPIYTRKLDRWGVPLAPAVVAPLGSCTSNPCGTVLSLAQLPAGYAIAYSDRRTAKTEVWMNVLDGGAGRIGGDHQVTTGLVDTDDGLITTAGAQLATVVRTANGASDLALEFAFVDATTFTGTFTRISPMPSSVQNVSLAKANGSYGVTWLGGGGVIQFVAVDGAALPIAPVATLGTGSVRPSIAGVGAGFALGWDNSLAIVDTAGAVSASPPLAVHDVLAVAATPTHLAVAADEAGIAVELELLDATTFAPGPVLQLGDGMIGPVAASDTAFLVAWVSLDGVLHVTPVCP